jgi:hypothetical protein
MRRHRPVYFEAPDLLEMTAKHREASEAATELCGSNRLVRCRMSKQFLWYHKWFIYTIFIPIEKTIVYIYIIPWFIQWYTLW